MTALHLCIDMQRAYRPRFSADQWSRLQSNIARLATELELLGIPTLYVAYTFRLGAAGGLHGVHEYQHLPKPMRDAYDWRQKLQIDLRLNPHSLLAFKTGYSAFMEPSIRTFAEQRGIRTVILSGMYEANRLGAEPHFKGHCVSQTAHHFRMAGCKTIIAADATNGMFSDKDKADDNADAIAVTASAMSRPSEAHRLARRKTLHKCAGIDLLSSREILGMLGQSHGLSVSKHKVLAG